MKNEKYNLEDAQAEASVLREKVKSGEATDYSTAERIVDNEANAKIKAEKEREVEELMGLLKDTDLNKKFEVMLHNFKYFRGDFVISDKTKEDSMINLISRYKAGKLEEGKEYPCSDYFFCKGNQALVTPWYYPELVANLVLIVKDGKLKLGHSFDPWKI